MKDLSTVDHSQARECSIDSLYLLGGMKRVCTGDVEALLQDLRPGSAVGLQLEASKPSLAWETGHVLRERWLRRQVKAPSLGRALQKGDDQMQK